jgi:glc operon protein GlcG
MPDRLPVQGGLPIVHEGECVGGIGVSGVQSSEDEEVASAGLAAQG